MNHGNNNTRPLTSKGEMQDLDPRLTSSVTCPEMRSIKSAEVWFMSARLTFLILTPGPRPYKDTQAGEGFGEAASC